jgi:hypothetical protein
MGVVYFAIICTRYALPDTLAKTLPAITNVQTAMDSISIDGL